MAIVCSLNSMYKIGFAKDIHRLVSNRALILGGVKIPYELGLLGHSDADVLTHAIAEAIIGALALGDLGKLFPDNDQEYKDISSIKLLAAVINLMKENEYAVENIDCTVSLANPKLAPFIDEMRSSISSVIECKKENVSIKAMSGNGVGEVGENIACEAYCIVLLKKTN